MDRLTATQVFIEVADRGSFSAAADTLGMSRAMVTRYVAELESWTGTRLFHRTTRRLSITSAGEICLHRCREIQALASELETNADPKETEPRGQVRIATSVAFAQYQLTQMVSKFLNRYPRTSVELVVSDRTFNLVENKIDLAIRISSELDPSLIAKKLGVCKSVVCASAEYLKKFGMPKSIEDLADHNCINHSYVGRVNWRFKKSGIEKEVTVAGNLFSNDATVLQEASLNHLGISVLPTFAANKFIKEKKLVKLLEDWEAIEFGIYAVYVSKKYIPPVQRALLDFLADEIKNSDW